MRRLLFLLLGLTPLAMGSYATGPEAYLVPKTITQPATAKNLTGPAIPNEVVIPTAREINPLTEKLIEISMANKVGNVLPNCAPHGRMDMLKCNIVSMLTKEQVVNGTNSLRRLSMLDFVAVEVGTRRASGKKVMFIQWGYCPKMKGHKKDPWAPWISLVRIFGGKSCVRVYLTDPSAEVAKEANAVQKAVEAMVTDTAEAVSDDGKYAKEERKQDKAIRKIEKQLDKAEVAAQRGGPMPGGGGPNGHNGHNGQGGPDGQGGPPGPNRQGGPNGPNGPGPSGEEEGGLGGDGDGEMQMRGPRQQGPPPGNPNQQGPMGHQGPPPGNPNHQGPPGLQRGPPGPQGGGGDGDDAQG